MEEYLESMKSLRSYMNDLEDDAAKRSVEEQQQLRAQAKQASEEAEQLVKARAKVGMQMAEKLGRIATLEIECAILKQTLELLHQETASTLVKLSEKRLFYTKTTETLTVKLQEQQEWLSMKNKITRKEPHGRNMSCLTQKGALISLKVPRNKHGKLDTQLVSAQLKIQDIKSRRSALLLEISKIKQILEQEKKIIAGFPQMDMKSLEEEYKALQCDKSGEVECLQSLDERINGMKGISDLVKCQCGLEYNVKLVGEAMDIS